MPHLNATVPRIYAGYDGVVMVEDGAKKDEEKFDLNVEGE